MSANLSIHIPQDRDESTGSLFSGLDVDFWTAFPEAVSVSWDDANGDPGPVVHRITLGQAEQLKNALEEILELASAKQDPAADADEDDAFRTAVARMEAAEAREDAAERRGKT